MLFFFFNDTATTEIYTLSLHDALPIFLQERWPGRLGFTNEQDVGMGTDDVRRKTGIRSADRHQLTTPSEFVGEDRKSTRLNSSHANISYAVFCLKKKNLSDTRRPESQS